MKTEQLHRPNFHLLEVSYLGATNIKGSRVKIHSPRFKQTVIINYDYYYNSILDIAKVWLLNNGFELIGNCEIKNGYGIISNTFKPLKEVKQ